MGTYGRLQVVTGGSAGLLWDLDEEGSFPIGRNPKARFRLEDPGVDLVHAGLHCGAEGVSVDTRSRTSPVRVNGTAVPGRCRLHPGDLLLVGGVTLEFLAPEGAPGSFPPPPARGAGEPFLEARLSGRAPLPGVLAGLGVGAAAAVPLGFLYGWFVLVNPCINVITFLFTFGFGIFVGMAAGWGMRMGKVRSRSAQAIVGGTVGLLALHLSWAVWVEAFLGTAAGMRTYPATSVGGYLLDPGDLLGDMGRICDRGAWSLFGAWAPTGAILGLIWIAEGVIVVGGAAAGATLATPALFCEECGTWGRSEEGVLRLRKMDPSDVKHHLENGDLAFLSLAERAREDTYAWTQVDVAACTGCGNTCALTVRTALRKREDKKESIEFKEVSGNLVLTREEADWIRALAEGGEPGRPGVRGGRPAG